MPSSLISSVRRWLRRVAVLSIVVGAPAHAAVYSGIWDPPYGSPFTNLGWRGTATYFVPDTCLPGGTVIVDNYSGCGGAAAVTSAQVEFYDTTAGLNPPSIATLVFNPASLVVDDLNFVGGQLTGLSTWGGSDYVDPTVNLAAYGVGSNTEFTLFFTLADGPRLGWKDCGYYGYATTHYYEPECSFGTNDIVNFPVTDFTITRIPEPGTLALATLALLGLAPRRVRSGLLPRR